MKDIFFVTTNSGKAESARMILRDYGYNVVQAKDSIEEPEETNDPKIIAREKVFHAIKKHNAPLICEDGGFFVNALNGRPGAKAHGYLSEHGLKGLLGELKGRKDRSAHFIGVLAYMEPSWKEPMYFEEKVEGKLLEEPRGNLKPHSWSELHLAFVPKGETKTIAEMSEKEYKEFVLKHESRFKRLGSYLVNRSE